MNINDLVFSLRAWVKKIKGGSVDFSELGKKNTLTMAHEKWNKLVQNHVSKDGNVDYRGFQSDSAQLDQYLEELSSHPPGKNWTEKEQLAYWINAYNAFTVKLIVDHYPVKSIKDIGDKKGLVDSPWDIKFFKIGGVDFDLGTIEHEILRKKYKEPRIHFAINCASYSCPILRNEAYTAEQLDQQLDDQTQLFLYDTNKNIITPKETKLSKIFNWFSSDFRVHTDVLTFIKKYNDTLNTENDVDYIEYQWTLNE